MARILIAGCGYVGSALGTRLATAGHVVYGLRRDAGPLPAGIRPIMADLRDPMTLRALPRDLDYVYYTAAAEGGDDGAYRAAYVEGVRCLLAVLTQQRQRPRRVLLTSSTSVFAQTDGAWVDETSPAEPAQLSSRCVLNGEAVLADSPFPSTVLRLGGIYGPGRAGLLDRVRHGLVACREGPPIYTNRVHRDDCAGALHHLMRLEDAQPLYLGVDHEPADQTTIVRWLAVRLGVPSPPPGATAPGKSLRWTTNKRCRNDRLIGSGYVFRFPTFREGYADLLAPTETRES